MNLQKLAFNCRDQSFSSSSTMPVKGLLRFAQPPMVFMLLLAFTANLSIVEMAEVPADWFGTGPDPRFPPDDELRKVFTHFDADNSEFIDNPELKEFMADFYRDPTTEQIAVMIREADMDGDLRVNFKEFKKIMEKSSRE